MNRQNLTDDDLIYWCYKDHHESISIWYEWGGPEFRHSEGRQYDEEIIIFCCIKNGLFHYIEE